MKLLSVQVQLFKNVLDSDIVQIQPDVTCLVGKNESGKTAFLHALRSLNPARENVTLSVPEHYPAWLEKKHRQRGDELEAVEPVAATFVLEDDDVAIVETVLGPTALESRELVLSRSYGGDLTWGLEVNEREAARYVQSKLDLPKGYTKRVDSGQKARDTIADFRQLMAELRATGDAADAEGAESIAQALEGIGEAEAADEAAWTLLEPRVPKVLYFDEYSELPYTVDIRELLRKPKTSLTESEATARALLELAGAEQEYLLNPDYERRKRELENVANLLTQDVLKYWTQNPALRVQPDITQRTETTPQGPTVVLDELKIRIWDDRHLLTLPFDKHSTGFQWFFSFLAAFSEFENSERPVLLLLDEPALGLHAKAQDDFLRFIEERLAPRCQVIYSTHSPFMVQPAHLERVRLVEDKGRDTGSKVSADVLATDPDTLFPLQGALGYELAQHLFVAPHNLVVEGTSDFTYLVVLSNHLKTLGRQGLDERWSLVPVGGADLVPTFVALLGQHLDLTVLVDSRQGGHQRLSKMAAQGLLAAQRIITIGGVIGTKLGDIEDLFDPDDYLRIYNRAFNASLTQADVTGGPIVAAIARHLGVPRFDHGVPADLMLRERDQLLPTLTPTTLSRFETLFETVNATLT